MSICLSKTWRIKGHMASMRIFFFFFFGKRDWKRPSGRARRKGKKTTKVDLQEAGLEWTPEW